MTDAEMRTEGRREQFELEHAKIHRGARDVTAARDLLELLERLAVFRAIVVAHFEQEEAPGGFFDFVRSQASANLGRAHQVEQEHTAYLATMDELDRRIRECLAGPVADILRQAGEMIERLKRHEAAEGRLLTDSLYMDSGSDH